MKEYSAAVIMPLSSDPRRCAMSALPKPIRSKSGRYCDWVPGHHNVRNTFKRADAADAIMRLLN
jgi:hypothetical protein